MSGNERERESLPVVDYPLQLRGDVVVHLLLPLNLTRDEVRRLVAFVETLVSEAAEADEH